MWRSWRRCRPLATTEVCSVGLGADQPDMRVFGVGSDGEFTEYEQLPFELDREESVLEQARTSGTTRASLHEGRATVRACAAGTRFESLAVWP